MKDLLGAGFYWTVSSTDDFNRISAAEREHPTEQRRFHVRSTQGISDYGQTFAVLDVPRPIEPALFPFARLGWIAPALTDEEIRAVDPYALGLYPQPSPAPIYYADEAQKAVRAVGSSILTGIVVPGLLLGVAAGVAVLLFNLGMQRHGRDA